MSTISVSIICAVASLLAAPTPLPPLPPLPPLDPPVEPAFPGQYAPKPPPNFPPTPKRCLEIANPWFRCPCLEWLAQDFASLTRYTAANERLLPQRPGQRRVLFFGDSITDNWSRPQFGGFFPGKPYVNRGIGGQATTQMLVRFRADVMALRPAVVVILAGTNDVSGNIGATPPEVTVRNLAAMVDLARVHGIRAVLASLLPVRDGTLWPSRTAERPLMRLRALNDWIAAFARANAVGFVDYHAAMVAPDGQMQAALTDDGVHPNAAGYAVMAPLAEKAIAAVMRRPAPRAGAKIQVALRLPPPPQDVAPPRTQPGPERARLSSEAAGPASARACADLSLPGDRCACLENNLFNFAGLDRYTAANATVPAAPTGASPTVSRVVFLGDSITRGWGTGEAATFFADRPYLNRGIGGQTTEQMLARFPTDVLALTPAAVVILAGINDIAGNTGKRTPAQIAGNVASMVELALARGIRPLLLSVLPVSDATLAGDRPQVRTGMFPPDIIYAVNRALAAEARRLGVPLVATHAAMADVSGHLRKEFTTDGLHLSPLGYAALAQLVEPALRAELARGRGGR